jgi:hypothetical protein
MKFNLLVRQRSRSSKSWMNIFQQNLVVYFDGFMILKYEIFPLLNLSNRLWSFEYVTHVLLERS